MKTKIFATLSACVCAVVCTIGLTACNPHTHSYAETIVAPTCTEQGYTLHECDCGDYYKDNFTEIIAHNYVDYVCTECGGYDPDMPTTEGLEFELNEDGESYSVVGIGTAEDTVLIIPSTYNEKPVTEIGTEAFKNCSSITSLIIGEGIKTIGKSAFIECRNLKRVAMPNSVTTLAFAAFMYCFSLESISLSANITSLEYGIFCDTALKEIIIPEGVTTIANKAFYYCENLTSVTIPSSVTEIAYDAFDYCNNLTSVNISDLAAWCNIEYTYAGNPLDYAQNLYLNGSLVENLVIPNGVTEIKDFTFYSCKSLKSVTIPNSVTYIGKYAFYECDNITDLTLPDSLTYLGDHAFCECSSLNSVTIPSGLTAINSTTFGFCTNLTSITIPNSVTEIGVSAFNWCRNLTDIYYNGTKAQWAAVTKEVDWNRAIDDYIIHCTDGDVLK